jgi:putative DNA primase/helicase
VNAAARGEAAEYRRRGWSPIPIKPRSKEPNLLELRPYLTRKATKEELDAWQWPGVGIVTGPPSGVLVLDVDGPEGEAELQVRGHPVTPMVRTTSGGLHLYFKHPEQHVRTGIRVAPGLDVKASGGYVVAPPSVGPNGRPYEWLISPEDEELADPPAWLMRLVGRERPKVPAAAVGERIPPGERNKVLASLAGTMRRRGMGEGEILAALQVTNEQRCQPLLEAEEVAKIASSVARYEPADDVVSISVNGHGAARPPAGYNLTDLGNAERFVRDHGENVRYCYPWGKWLVWTGSRWQRDEVGRVHKLAKETVRSIYREASNAEEEDRRKAVAKHAAASESEARIRAMLELSKSEVPISPHELDADPWLFNAPNGTVDLRSGKLRGHRHEDLLTKMAGTEYRPDADAPEWASFLERVLPGDELRAFVQRAAGYSATGDTSEQCMFIDHGSGANGKSTFQEALASALGDYAMRAPTEMLMAKRTGGVPNDVARLKGARFVAASETEEGRRLAESLVKDLTGQDTISARFMRAEWFDFQPTHKLWLSTNHKPEIRGTDPAIWRRIRLVPWSVAIPPAEQDRKLLEKLRGELPGVLAWIVRGCIEWQREGLKAPDDVRRATVAYRTEMDMLGAFLQECCIVHPDSNVAAKDLYAAYKLWCQENGERTETQRRFGARLTERGGFERYRGGKSGGHRWRGLELLTLWESAICRGSDLTDPKAHMNSGENTSHVDMRKKGSEGSAEPASEASLSSKLPPGVSATLEQLRRIEELERQGFGERGARMEVLAKGHPLGCDCAVCS